MQYHQMIKISKISINKIKEAFINKQYKCKWDQQKQAQVLMPIKKLTIILIK
jgi:hypothetical protein